MKKSGISYSKVLVAIMMILSTFAVVAILFTGNASANLPAYDCKITWEEDYIKQAQKGELVLFKFKVENEGANSDTYWVNTTVNSTKYPGWSVGPSGSKISVAYNGEGEVNVDVTVNNTPIYPSTIKVTITIESTNDANVKRSTSCFVQIKPTYGVSFGTTTAVSLEPGATVDKKFNITNTGNIDDSFELMVVSWPSGWQEPGIDWDGADVGPGLKTLVTMTVYVPESAAQGGYPIKVKATSTSDNKTSAQRTITISVTQKYGVKVQVKDVPNTKFIDVSDPGAFVEFNVSIQNKGNGIDDFSLTPYTSSGWIAEIADPNVNQLGVNEITYTTLTVRPPASTYLAQGSNTTITIQGKSLNDATVKSTTKAYVNVKQHYDLFMTCVQHIKTGDEGTDIIYHCNITNKGNGEDTVSFTMNDLTGWNTPIFPSQFTIGPGSVNKTAFNVTVRVPTDALSTVPYQFDLTATSEDMTTTAIQSLIINVNPIYGFEATPQQGASYVVEDVNPADNVVWALQIENTGNRQDRFVIAVSSDTWNPIVDYPFTPQIQAGGVFKLNVSADAPTDAVTGTYNMTVFIKSYNDNTINETITLRAKIPEVYQKILNVAVKTGKASGSVQIGSSVTYEAIVQNLGTQTDTYNIELTYPNYGDKIKFSIDKLTIFNLAPSAEKKVNLTVEILTGADPALGSVYCHVSAESETDENVKSMKNFTTSLKDEYSGQLTTANNFQDAVPGDFVEYTITLNNSGTVSDTFEVRIMEDEDNPFDSITIDTGGTNPTRMLLAANREGDFVLNVSVPSISSKIIPVGTYEFIVEVWSEGGDLIVDNITLQLEIKQVYSVDILTIIGEINIDPGNTAKFELRIKNKGNGDDTLLLSAFGPKASWASFPDGSSRTLAPNGEWKFNVSVAVPETADSQDHIIYIDVKSSVTVDGVINKSVRIKALVDEYFKVVLEETVSLNKDLDPGQTFRFEFRLKNAGTATDTYDLEVATGTFKDWVDEFGIIENNTYVRKSSVALAKSASVTVWANVTVDDDADTGTKTISMRAKSANEDGVADTIDIKVNVQPKRDLELDATVKDRELVPTLSGSSYTKVAFNVIIRNKGTADDDFKIEYFLDDPDLRVSGPSAKSVNKNQEGTIKVTVESIKNNIAPKDVPLLVNVTSEAPTPQGQDITKSIELTVNVAQAYDVDLTAVGGDDKKTGDTFVGEYREVVYTLNCQNLGTAEDTDVLIEIVEGTYAEWATIDGDTTLSIPKGAKKTFNVTVEIPKEQATGKYDIKIKATSAGNSTHEESDISDTITLTTEVTQFYEFTFDYQDPASGRDTGTVGDTVVFTLKIKNEGNDVDTVAFKMYNNSKNWARLSASSKNLNPGQEATVDLSVEIPNDNAKALADKYIIDVRATSEDKVFFIQLPTTTVIEESAAMEVKTSDEVYSKSIKPGESHTYDLQIKNKGNAVDTFIVTKLGDKTEWISIHNGTSEFEILPGKTQTVKVTVTIPDLEDVSDPEEILAGLYTQTIQITSNNDDKKVETIDFLNTVKQVYSIQMDSETNRVEIDANSRDGAEFRFTLRNLGNKQDTIKLETSPKSVSGVRFDFSKASQTLGVDQQVTTTLTITLDTSFKATTLNFKIRATPANGQESSSRQEIQLTTSAFNTDDVEIVLNKADLTIPEVRFDFDTTTYQGKEWYFVKKGVDIEYTITIANNGTEEVGNFKVIIKANNKEVASKTVTKLEAGATTDIVLEAEVKENKDQKIEVHVDSSNSVIESSDSNNKYSFTLDEEPDDVKDGTGDVGGVPILYVILAAIIGLLLGAIIVGLLMRQGIIPSGTQQVIDDKVAEKERPGAKKKAVAAGGESKALAKKGADKPTPGKKVKIQCPNCEEIQTITSAKRPITVDCSSCGKKLVLTK